MTDNPSGYTGPMAERYPRGTCPICGAEIGPAGGHVGAQTPQERVAKERQCFGKMRAELLASEREIEALASKLDAARLVAGDMRRLDAFAAAALQGLLAAPADVIHLGDVPDARAAMCRLAWEFADGMLLAGEPARRQA